MVSLLHGVAPFDPATYIGVALLLGAVALVACWMPARAATRVDPMVVLKADQRIAIKYDEKTEREAPSENLRQLCEKRLVLVFVSVGNAQMLR